MVRKAKYPRKRPIKDAEHGRGEWVMRADPGSRGASGLYKVESPGLSSKIHPIRHHLSNDTWNLAAIESRPRELHEIPPVEYQHRTNQ